jgi:hypothetical protein
MTTNAGVRNSGASKKKKCFFWRRLPWRSQVSRVELWLEKNCYRTIDPINSNVIPFLERRGYSRSARYTRKAYLLYMSPLYSKGISPLWYLRRG